MQNKLAEILIAEKDSIFLWLLFLFGLGIIIYFKLPFEPDYAVSILSTIILILSSIIARKSRYLLPFFLIATTLAFGFLCANTKTILIKSPVLKYKTGVTKLTGTIERIETRKHGKRFILKDLEIEKTGKTRTPKKIRVNINKNSDNILPGYKISLLASLSPPPKPVIPGGYDFSRHAYFKQIGAVGYAVSDIEIISKPTSFSPTQFVANIRETIKNRIKEVSSINNGQIAMALLVGDKGGIDKQTIENIRTSGIAHILAISGMHLSLVAAIFFFSSRLIFASIGKLALQHNIKKWAAFIAIIGSFIYLLISGNPISAQRAFIMTSLILFAVILDRTGTPMRSVAIAAFIVLFISPESILTPSFQMSFAAVFALIGMYELFKPLFKNYFEFGLLRKLSLYLFGIVFSSFVAGLATAPFALYHFNNFAPYGIFTNLIVVPMTSLIVMPLGVITLILMPLKLESISLIPMLYFIDIIIQFSNYIANLPQPVGEIPQIPDITLAMVTIGGLVFLFFKTNIRLTGIALILIGLASSFNSTIPNIIIGNDAKLIALKTDFETLAFSSRTHERYSREKWQERYGIKKSLLFSEIDKNIINCDEARCHYNFNGKLTSIVKHPIALKEDCSKADIVINLTYIKHPCSDVNLSINKQEIRKKGASMLQYSDREIDFVSVSSLNNGRAWQ